MQVSKDAKFDTAPLVGLPATRYQELLEQEGQMAATDVLQTATDEAKNSLEEYLLALRSDLGDRYLDFVTAEEREALTAALTALEDWLYEDGEEEKKSVRLLPCLFGARISRGLVFTGCSFACFPRC